MIHCFEALQLDRVGPTANHLIQNGTSERVQRMFLSRHKKIIQKNVKIKK